jgi:Helix-turn-helix domain
MGKDNPTSRGQRDRILKLLVEARGEWVPLPAVLELGIAQYGARLLELRRTGFDIQNKTWWEQGGKHSAFRLILGTKVAPLLPAAPTPPPTYQQEPLFHFVLEHRDDG